MPPRMAATLVAPVNASHPSCVVPLGRKVVGFMGNHAYWIDQVGQAAQAGEDVWPLPCPRTTAS